VATEAAGEGINLQCCNILFNYDIPWNPNRLEQRMGRIHRYGQKQDVMVFNMVASNTKEGKVLERLLKKLDIIRESMGKMFNVFVRLLAELPFRDTQCGFKSFRRAAAQAVFERCRVNGFAFDVEALIIAQRLGYRLADMPVRWVNSPQSKVKILLHPLQMFIELVGIRWRNRR
jgi:superfamily II DNA or RNA helicase